VLGHQYAPVSKPGQATCGALTAEGRAAHAVRALETLQEQTGEQAANGQTARPRLCAATQCLLWWKLNAKLGE